MTWPVDVPVDDVLRLIERGIGDPGSVLPRGDDYGEALVSWCARAVHKLLVDAEVLVSIDLSGSTNE